MLIAALTLLLVPSHPRAQEPSQGEETQQVEVTYLANAGFLIRSGSHSFLIDAFVPQEIEGLDSLDSAVRKKLLAGKAPFDLQTISLTSHAHPDHFKAPFAHRALTLNPKIKIISSEEVLRALAQGGKNWDRIGHRAAAFQRNENNKPKPFLGGKQDISIQFLDLPHVKVPEEAIENIGHLVRIADFKFIHLGDAAPDFRAFKELKLKGRKIDVAFVPYWFYASEEGTKIIDKAIRANHVIVYHIPTKDKVGFTARLKEANPNALFFENKMDRKIFEVAKRSE